MNAVQPYHPAAALFRTLDFGETWTAVQGTAFTTLMEFDTGQPGVLYAVMGGLLRQSTDDGATWTVMRPPSTPRVFVIDPASSAVLYGAGELGLSKSTDTGRTWRTLTTGFTRWSSQINALAIDPQTPPTLYAGAREGVWKSLDGGETWEVTGLFRPVSFETEYSLDVHTLAIDPKTPSTVYAGGRVGVYKSTDAGQTWKLANSGIADRQVGAERQLVIDPVDPSTLYMTTMRAESVLPLLFKTTDGGETWRRADEFGGAPRRLILNPQAPEQLFVAGTGGLYMSSDGAESWNLISAQLPYFQVSTAAIDPFTGAVFAATFENPVDAIVGKLKADGSALLYATYIGGSGNDFAQGIALDDAGRILVTGTTESPDFPIVQPIQPRKGWSVDGFIIVLEPEGSGLTFSSYLGGDGGDAGTAVAPGPGTTVYVVGHTNSREWLGGTSQRFAFSGTAVLWRLDWAMSAVQSWLLFGVPNAVALATSPTGIAYVAGAVAESAFCPVTQGQSAGYIVASGPAAVATCLAGTGSATGIGVGPEGQVVVVGETESAQLPLANAFEREPSGSGDTYVTMFGEPPRSRPSFEAIVNGASFRPDWVAPGAIASLYGSGMASGTASAGALPLPRSLIGTSVTFNGVPAPLLFVSFGQINLQVPFETPPGEVTVEVISDGGKVSRTIRILERALGIFVNYDGSAAALHAADMRPVTPRYPARKGEVVIIYATGLGRLNGAMVTGAAPPDPPPRTAATPEVRIGYGSPGEAAEVLWSGAAPGYPGVYQLNVRVPMRAPSGDSGIFMETGNYATIAIQ